MPVFKNFVNVEHIGFESASGFESKVVIAYKTLEKEIQANKFTGAELIKKKSELAELGIQLERAKVLRRHYLTEMKRRNIPANEVKFVLDFSSKELGPYGSDGEAIILSVVIASSVVLDLTPLAAFREDIGKGTKVPFEKDAKPMKSAPEKKKRERGGDREPKKQSVSEQNRRAKLTPKIAKVQLAQDSDKPNYVYIDFIAKKSDIIDGQTSDYVRVALDMLFDCRLFSRNGIKTVTIWSDGCGKHFKTYAHLWYLTTVKKKFPWLSIRRRFLPPNLSYNICDSHFAHFKVKVKAVTENFQRPGNLTDVGWLLAQLSSTYVIVLSDNDYAVWDHEFAKLDERFIRHNFDFEILELNKLRARGTMEGDWKKYTLIPSTGVAAEEIGEDDLAPTSWYKNSSTWTKHITPLNGKRNSNKVRRLYEAPAVESEDESAESSSEVSSDGFFSDDSD
jgi:hypothetical protein